MALSAKPCFRALAAGVALAVFGAAASSSYATAADSAGQDGWTHPNGYGPDPDGDGNPATRTRPLARSGPAAEAGLDPPFRIINFEAPPGRNGEPIGKQYAKDYGVIFGPGLNRQICQGQRYFQYDTQCTYLSAPSGAFAAVHRDDYRRPLSIEFTEPVCAAALAIYPTGGREGEMFRVRVQPYAANGAKLDPASISFRWTKDTFRWRNMAGAFFTDARAARIEISMRSRRAPNKPVSFLIDDVAFVDGSCDGLFEDIPRPKSLAADDLRGGN